MDVSISGIVKEVLIDPGSVNNLIGEDDFQKLENSGFTGNIEHCSTKLFPCGGKKVDVIGQFGVDVPDGNLTVPINLSLESKDRAFWGM